MIVVPELLVRYQTLSRRVASLPSELDAWIDRASVGSTLEKNFSQIRALRYFMRAIFELNGGSLSALDDVDDIDAFLADARDLSENVTKAHAIWDFFRARLNLRFVPQFQQSLLIADVVTYDCYSALMDRAEALQIQPKFGFREYPLVGLSAEPSPVTYPRGRRPPALQSYNLPVPVIDLPWDYLVSPWELISIAHEVGHDVDEDLGGLTRELRSVLAKRLSEAGVPRGRLVRWQEWTGEILADLIGVLLTGPAFTMMLSGLLTLPRGDVYLIRPLGEHPPHYLRIFINTALLRRLGLSKDAAALEAGWSAIYGDPSADFEHYQQDIEPFIAAILDTPLATLRDQDGQLHSLSVFCGSTAFEPDDQERVQEAAGKLAAGISLDELRLRHIVSASQLAFEHTVKLGQVARLDELALRTRNMIIEFSPGEQLPAAGPSSRARRHLDNLARAILERPLEDFGIYSSPAREEQ